MGRLWRRSLSGLGAAALLTSGALAGSASFGAASATAAASSTVCSGTWAAPGTLSGTYSSVSVTGVCFVNGGPAVVTGSVIVARGAALVAAFAMNNASLTVGGNILVQAGATLVLGCEASESPCLDDPNQQQPTLDGVDVVKGSLIATNALGVLVHNATINGSVVQSGGGGGFNCNPDPVNPAFSFAVFSAYDDNSVGGGLSISNLTSCYMGVARNRVGGSVNIIGNQLADNDAIEILSNTIGGSLSCFGNSMTWNNVETGPDLFPRVKVPINSVRGRRSGQCVLASPTVLGGPLGPGPF